LWITPARLALLAWRAGIADFGDCRLKIQDFRFGISNLQSAFYILKSQIVITFRNLSVRKERFAPGGKVYIQASAPFHDRHYNEMGSTLDRNDNQGTGAFWALVHGRDHSSGPGIGATDEMLFQTRTRFVSKRRYVD
jgi:hypothetical protein